MEDKEQLRKKIQELEMLLDETVNLSKARSKLLETNVQELNEVYVVLKEKLRELRHRDERIKDFEASLATAHKLSALGELAGSIAHEIKNPLISIQGFAERVAKTTDIEKINKYAKLISKEAGRLSKVLATLLDFTRMNEPKQETLDVNSIVDDTVIFMEHHLTRFKNVELVVDSGKELPFVVVDKIQIQQILVNIMMNAAQAMPSGGVIRIATAKENGNISISVQDSGTGISKDDINRIFEPFFTTKTKGEGTGLGLSICKRFIDANGGKILVESEAGKGTLFKILLPGKSSD